MHTGEQVPIVDTTAPMHDAIYEMSKKSFGITAVVRGDRVLEGVISDGDLRRLLQRDEEIVKKTAGDCMKRNPVTIEANQLASAALQIMEQRKITSLFIVDDARRVEGLIHLHDLWGLELF